MAIIDTFIYNGEADVLELRLAMLSPHVDRFVIVEAATTFSGKEKSLFYPQQKDRFKEWESKITYVVVDESNEELWNIAKASPNTGGVLHWCREFYQREYIRIAIQNIVSDDDIVYVSDVDEIWNPTNIDDGVFHLSQKMYTYYLNNRSAEHWYMPFVGKYKFIKDKQLNHLRSDKSLPVVQNGGWHFTNIGGAAFIKSKLESYSHQEYNTQEIKDKIQQRIDANQDFVGRSIAFWKDESDWPQYLKDNKQKYAHLCKS